MGRVLGVDLGEDAPGGRALRAVERQRETDHDHVGVMGQRRAQDRLVVQSRLPRPFENLEG